MKKNIFFSCLVLGFLSFTVFTKSDFAKLVEDKLQDYTLNHSPEKIYIHTDKPYYSLENHIWFTSYLVDGITHKRATKSWVVHVDIVNDQDSIFDKKMLFTNNISVSGDFKIGKDWKPGNYMIRGYTNYMRNAGNDFFFKKRIEIISSTYLENFANDSISKKPINNLYQQEMPKLEFFPEGGDLVENIRSKIAVKVKNAIYQDNSLQGKIVDDTNTTILEFKTGKFGMAMLSLKPEPNKAYMAIVEVNGAEYSYPLPKALPYGYALNVVNLGESLLINAQSTVAKGVNQSYLVIHQRGKFVYSKYFSEETKEFKIRVPVKGVKDGVTHLTLFNPEGNPVCERLVYISSPSNKVIVDITKDKEIINKREKITLSVNTKDSDSNSVQSHLSMTVKDMGLFPRKPFSNNIKTYLLLNSDLRGEINNPGYFFIDEYSPAKRYLLDLVMLTNGWRRFIWKDLLYKKRDSLFVEEKGLFISGKTQLLKKPYGPIPSLVQMSFLGKSISQEPIQKTDSLGRFNYGPFIFFDTIPIIVEARLTDFKSKNDKERNVLIFIDDKNATPKVDGNIAKAKTRITEFQVQEFKKVAAYIKQVNEEFNRKMQVLEEVTIVAKKKEELSKRNQEMNERTLYGNPSNRIDVESSSSSIGQSAIDLLFGTPGVLPNGGSVTIRGSNGPPLVLLDDFPIDVDFLSTLYATDISFIDVLTGANAAVFANSGNGVIAIYSRRGGVSFDDNTTRKPGIINFDAQGFYTAKAFYAPDHVNGIEEQTKADIRTTLHWEPKIRINLDGPQNISFFASDSKGDYIVEIEGVTDSGIPVYSTTTFYVD